MVLTPEARGPEQHCGPWVKPDAWGLVAGEPVIAQVHFKPHVPDSVPPHRVRFSFSCGAQGCPSSLCFLLISCEQPQSSASLPTVWDVGVLGAHLVDGVHF